jgi:hypothetical protein
MLGRNPFVRWFLFSANVVPSSPILVTLMMEVLVPVERRFLQELRGVTSQKMALFIVTAVKPQILHRINRLDSVAER